MRVPRTPLFVLMLGLGVGVTRAAPGDPVGNEFQVNTFTVGSQRVFGQPVAQVGTGFVVVWRSYDTGADPMTDSVQAQRYAADGAPFGGQFRPAARDAESVAERGGC